MDNYGITHLTDGAKTNNDRVKSNGGLIKHPIFQLYRAYLFIGILNSALINSNLGHSTLIYLALKNESELFEKMQK